MVIHLPLDLEYWFVTIFSGTEEIFTLVALIAITFMCAKLRMPMSAYIGMLVLFSGLLWGFYGMNVVLIVIILIGGLIGALAIRRSQD